MKKFLKFSLSFCFLLLSLYNFSQDLPEIIPLSPNAASIAKYGEVPIGYFTGTPNINIDLYTVNSRELSLPLRLSYHSVGNKVESIASWVGLGWSLGTIPSISRTVRGIADEEGGYFSLYSGKTVKEFWELKDSNPSLFNGFAGDLHLKRKDSEPDIFYYNLPGESGKFFWNQEAQTFVTFPKSNTKILRDGNGFILIDQNGIQYIMDAIETNTPNGGNAIRTTWKATEMIAASKKDRITFTYRDEFQIIKTANVVTKYHVLGGLGHIPPNEGSLLVTSRTVAKIIKKITFDQGYIEFNEGSTTREDLQGGGHLDHIAVYDNNNNLITKYQLIQRYKSGNGSSLGECSNAESYVRKWMLLDKLDQISKDDSSRLTHSFTYNESNFPACRRSAAQDYWGYYNGHDDNKNLIPSYNVPTFGYPIVISGADRSIDPNKSQFGILKKITYPTKGYTVFSYENNEVRNDGIIPPQCVDDYVAMDGGDIFEPEDPIYPRHTETTQFTINNSISECNPLEGANVKFTIADPGCDLSNGLASNCARFTIKGSKPGSNTIDITFPGSTFYLPNDTYEMKASFDQEIPNYQYFLFLAEWTRTDTPSNPPKNKYIGGLRIKEIKNYTAENTLSSNTEYSYGVARDSITSSGDIFVAPNFSNELQITYFAGHPQGGVTNTQLYRVQATSNMQQVTYSGSPVGYSKVYEKKKGDKNIGYTEYTYSNARDEFAGHVFPYVPGESMELERGQLVGQKDYLFDAETNTYRIRREKRFSYSRHSYASTTLYPKSSFALKWGNYSYGPGFQFAQNIVPYNTTSGWNSLSSERTISFDKNGVITSSQSYYHDNAAHLLKTRVTSYNSDNKKLSTMLMYPQDVSPVAPALQNLIDQNRLAAPIKTETILSDTNENELSRSQQETIYRDWSTNLVLPEIVQTLKGKESTSNQPEARLIYHEYDSYGNPVEVSKSDGVSISYLWGYNQKHPIAKLENASLSEVAIALGITQEVLKTYNEDNLSEINDLRTNLPNAMITTYTYDPLIGVTSITDPKGYTIYYTYDDFNRLEFVKDAAGKLISENRYKYKGQ